MLILLTLLAGIGGTLLGYGLNTARVNAAETARDQTQRILDGIRAGELNLMGFSEGSAASWKKSCLEAQQATVEVKREANRLREQLDVARIAIDDPVLPELVTDEIDVYWLPPVQPKAFAVASRSWVSHR